MKKPGLLAAATATAAVFSASSDKLDLNFDLLRAFEKAVVVPTTVGEDSISGRGCSSADKFAPRFDGLRFIETLITAHR